MVRRTDAELAAWQRTVTNALEIVNDPSVPDPVKEISRTILDKACDVANEEAAQQ